MNKFSRQIEIVLLLSIAVAIFPYKVIAQDAEIEFKTNGKGTIETNYKGNDGENVSVEPIDHPRGA